MGERKPNLTYFLILVFSIIFILQLYYLYVYGEDFLNDIFYNYGFSVQNVLDGRLEVFITSKSGKAQTETS